MWRRLLKSIAERAYSSKSFETFLSQTFNRYSTTSTAATTTSTARYSATKFITSFAGASLLAYSLSSTPSEQHVAHASAPSSSPSPVLTDPYKLPSTPHGMPKSIVLYQYEVCPFCCKVKAFLDYHKIPYRAVEVNPLTKSELKWSEYKKVPVVLLDGNEQVNDSSAIISRLSVDVTANREVNKKGSWWSGSNKNSASTAGTVSRDEEEKWRRWVDERLVRVITVNIYRTAHEAFQTFDYITEHGNFGRVQKEAARVVGAVMMWSLSNKLKKKYNVEGDVREVLYQCADEWVQAVGDKKFLGGDQPNLADLAVFGVMRSTVGTDTFMDLQHETPIGSWYERMMGAVGESSRME